MLRLLGFSLMVLMASPLSAANWLVIDPSAPVAGNEVRAEIGWGGSGLCRTSLENLDGVRFDSRTESNTVYLDLVLAPPPTACIPGPPSFVPYPLGSLPAGSYTLVVSEVGADTSFPVSSEQRTELASMVFGVAPAPMAIPVNQPLALLVLVGVLFLVGVVYRRRQGNVA